MTTVQIQLELYSQMSNPDLIWEAVKQILNGNPNGQFKRVDVRRISTIPEGSFTSPFQAMCEDQPGGAPYIQECLQGIFSRIGRGLYTLSEKGRALLAEVSKPVMIELKHESQLLENEGYFIGDDRVRILREVAQRQGQVAFRQALIKAYNFRCAVTGCDAIPALEAAHISPYEGTHSNQVSNGLLLRADIHTLFDLNFLKIDPENLKVFIDIEIRDTVYSCFHEKTLVLPREHAYHPNKIALRDRWIGPISKL